METIKELVRSLALLVLLAAFLELLLPTSKMKRYIQLVLGLFVIVTVLQPVTRFIGQADGFGFLAWSPPAATEDLKTILDQGQGLARQGERALDGMNGERLGKQMEAMIRLIPGVEEAAVKVVTEGGMIRSVEVQAREGTPAVEEVQIGEKPAILRTVENLHTRQEIVDTLVDFYGLKPEQIQVYPKGGGTP